MRVDVLGATAATVAGRPADLGGRRQRALLAALVLGGGRPVAVDALVAAVWGTSAPPGAVGTLQTYVAGLRRVLEPDRPARTPAQVLVTAPPGYALRVPEVDARAFATSVDGAARVLRPLGHAALPGPGLLPAADVRAARDDLRAALQLWRATPYLDLGDDPGAVAERARLAELRVLAEELSAAAALALGEDEAAVGRLESLTAEHPLRERLWTLRATALARSGRQADALEALRELRTTLADELGLDPGPQAREVEQAVLRQDDALHWTAPAEAAVPPAATDAPVPRPAADAVVRQPSAPPRRPLPAELAQPAEPAELTDPAEPVEPADPAEPAASSQPTATTERAASTEPAARTEPAAPTAPTAPAEPAGPPGPPAIPAPDWPLVGRDDALATLTALLDDAATGVPRFAALVGDPGIGKTRLAEELVRAARARGATTVVTTGSQDEGAPPLWPWVEALAALGVRDRDGLGPGSDSDHGGFTADTVARALSAAAQRQLLLVVLDDLQWVDAASQRVLRHVVRTARDARLVLVGTWRAHPPPSGALAETVDALARRHALRLDLSGLDRSAVAQLVGAVASSSVADREAERLRSRTDGNPFFLVEYARLRHPAGDGRTAEVPPALTDVLGQRVATLPDETARALGVASVLGREFDVRLLAAVLDVDEDSVLDRLEPARAAGLLGDVDVDRCRFAHALVRDALYDGLPLSRRGRLHARAAAALEGGVAHARDRGDAGRATADVARHWLAAGDRHASRAWRAAVAAANDAAAVVAHEEEAALLAAAVGAARADPDVDDAQLYELLMARVAASRVAGDIAGVDAAVDEAIVLARRLGDLALEVAAAVAPSEGVLWQPRPYETVHDPVVRSLRHALTALPPGDSALRCQVMISLACELYYAASVREREALCDEAVAMARRLADPALVQRACQGAFIALWRPSTTRQRLALAEEAAAAGRVADDDTGLVTSLTLIACAHGELGNAVELRSAAAVALAAAERWQHAYAYVVVQCLRAPWLAMEGRLEEAYDVVARAVDVADRTSLPQAREGIDGAAMIVQVFSGQGAQLVAEVDSLLGLSRLPLLALGVAMTARYVGVDRARTLLGDQRIALQADDWYSLLDWTSGCEVGFRLGLPGLAARAYERCAPLAGHMTCGGSGVHCGPVDAWLAYGAAATGQWDLARRHADDAAALLDTWQLPLAAQWWRAEREQHGF